MAEILPVSFIFNETQNIPTYNLSYNVEIFIKLVEMSNKSLVNNDEVNHIKTHLITLEMQYQNLFNLCQDINKSIIKVNDKLSQYDIDEITEVEEVVNEITEVEEVVNEITKITEIEEVVNEITKITEIVNEVTEVDEVVTEVDEVVNEITEVDEVVNEITEVVEDSKPKRKYNRRKK